MWYNFFNIVAVFLSLTGGAYGIVLLSQLRTRYNLPWINSLFFYQILIYLFGIYGLLGNALVRNVLLKFEVNLTGIESVARLIPYLGLPLLITAWFLLITCVANLVSKKLSSFITIAYFILFTLGFLIYGILLNRLTSAESNDYSNINSSIRFTFYISELLVVSVATIFAIIHLPSIKKKHHILFILRFIGILIIWVVLKSLGLHFIETHYLIKLYYFLLFFVGTLPLILLSKSFLLRHEPAVNGKTSKPQLLFSEYNITPREQEIIQEICKGKTNKQIADDLFITLQTVKDHCHNIFKKVEVKNRVQLVQMFSEYNS